jgi:predicted actin-binding protein
MRTPTAISRTARLLGTTLALALLAAPAAHAADTPFTARFAQTVRGDIAAVGNTLLTCPSATAGCTNAQDGIGATLNNNNWNMTPVNVAGGTVNSSAATVTLPSGATVLWAGLYWSADTSAGTNGAAAPNAAAKGTVGLKVPGAASYQPLSAVAGDVLTSSVQATRYRAFKDVTTLVANAGAGTYSVADVQAGTGQDRYAGWALIVAYRDNTQPMIRRLNVYDGLGTVDSGHTFTTTIAPFHTPANGAVTTKAGLLSFEGDASLATETATFNAQALTDGLNPVNNAMNSTIEAGGARFAAKSPDYVNQFGVDLDTFTNNPGNLGNDKSSAVLAFGSTNEYFMPSAFFLVSDEGPATITGAPSVVGVPKDDGTLTANPGTWNGTGPLNYSYQWQRCDAAGNNCQSIPGATGSSYTPSDSDVGSTIRVVVTATNDAGSSAPVTSAATAVTVPSAPSSTSPPSIPGGGATSGQTLTADPGTWSGTGAITNTYQWQRCDANGNHCHDITGATQKTYTPSADDVGGTVRVVVGATNAVGAGTAATSAAIPVAAAPPPANTGAPAVGGSGTQGQALTADPGTWNGTGPVTYAYQWQRCDADGNNCEDITGATDATYVPTSDDVGHTLRAQITATDDSGKTTTVTTTPTAPVVAASDPNDVSGVTGNLTAETSCQQLVGGAKYRRVALAGVGTVRVRAYTTGPALKSSPLRLTTEVTGGRAKSVRYSFDGRPVAAAKAKRFPAALTPAQLGKVGVHTLKTAVKGRRGAAKSVSMQLATVPCQTLFTAQRWRTTAGAGLRLRIDARTALTQLSFGVPAALLPAQTAKPRTVGFIRLFVADAAKPVRYPLTLPARGVRTAMLAAQGRPTVTLRRGGLKVAGLPARSGVAEVTLYRVTKLDRATSRRPYTVRVTVSREGAKTQTLSARPKAPR